jgi:fructose-specific phosphotransferase system IIA component
MGIADHINPENIILNIETKSRNEVFHLLASSLTANGRLGEKEAAELVTKLEDREKLSTTGIGEGIAIPHASIDSIQETVILLGVAPNGVDFNSIDGKPVDIIFMIIGSQAIPRQHIQILAKIVRLCRNKELMNKIRTEFTSPQETLDAIRMMEG